MAPAAPTKKSKLPNQGDANPNHELNDTDDVIIVREVNNPMKDVPKHINVTSFVFHVT